MKRCKRELNDEKQSNLCFYGIQRVLKVRFKKVPKVIKGNFKNVSGRFQVCVESIEWCFKKV